jgi:formylglycine-generating enzyme required for sulfatase activity
MSPEQARSEELDARADVYSIGAMMYELVTGSAPYAPKGLRLRAHRILEELTAGPPRRVDELRRDVPSALAAVIDKAMQRDRAHRYASVQQLADDIRAFLAQRVVSAHKTGAWEETKLWLRRNRQVAWSLAVTAATLVAGIVTTSVLWQGATLAREDAEMRGRQFEMLAMVVDYERMIASEPIGVGSPEQLPTMRAWTKETEGFLARVEPALRQPVQIDDTSTTSPSARDAARFLVGRMDELARNLPRLRSLLDAVATRQRWAEAVERLTLAHQHAAASWDEVRTAIATSPRYVGQNIDLSNANIWGLVPIGENPQSGLWEFYDLRSAWNGSSDPASLERAEIPKADSSGRLRLDGNTGIVWVLTPAGVVDTQTRSGPDGTTNRAVPIDPFLMSKYEVTRGQWHRWTGAHPSSSPREGEGALPVVDINWFTCDQILRLHGLAMPTELQAEHALRGGTKTPWWSGTEESSILLAENVGEGTKLLLVGSKQPNPFGLMDLGGNVWEWCQDQYGEYGAERHGDGRRPDSAEVLDRSIRGGGYGDRAERAKSEHRHKNLPTSRGPFLGVRPIRLLR